MPTPDITTYAGLTTAIEQYIQVEYAGDGAEPTFVSNIPNFIKNAEILINNRVQLPALRVNKTSNCTANFPYIDLPVDFLSMFSFAVMPPVNPTELNPQQYSYLLNKDVNYIREAFPFPGVTGLPKYYGLFDNSAFILGPTPDQEYQVELHYYAKPVSIVTAGSTWVSQNFPNVLLWGSLVEAYIFAKGENELIQTYQAKFEEAIQEMKQLGDGKDRQDNYRTTQVRDKVV